MNQRMCTSPFLLNLPSEIMINILSRLPIRSIQSCKCVCKQLLNLLSTLVFAASHLPLSTPGLVIRRRGSDMNSDSCQIFQLEDEDEFELQHHNLHYNQVMEFDLSKSIGACDANIWIKGSVDGLICMQDLASKPYDSLYICNPITREYIALPGIETVVEYPHLSEYGFGQSKISGQYKVVRNVHRHSYDHQAGPRSGLQNYECLVYTVGTRSWISIEPGPSFGHYLSSFSLFLNGNLHGFLHDYGESVDLLISCFNLEAESFRPFPPPPPPLGPVALGTLGILDDCLCFLDNSSEDEDIIVKWVMKEYGVGESWTKQFVISNSEEFVGSYFEAVYPIKAFKDGEILLSWDNNNLFYFSSKTETCQKLELVIQNEPGWIEVIPHCSTFLSLKSFTGEDVILFS
ncbi:F-box/kelch-repeat protein At3g23880-like [Primulina tabacum]|uniref:F-box/kelch-repeat protein At3g23880-like n=1 Tax=Primulina tabacum TaxID=48773 RepID=UPI003F5A56E2